MAQVREPVRRRKPPDHRLSGLLARHSHTRRGGSPRPGQPSRVQPTPPRQKADIDQPHGVPTPQRIRVRDTGRQRHTKRGDGVFHGYAFGRVTVDGPLDGDVVAVRPLTGLVENTVHDVLQVGAAGVVDAHAFAEQLVLAGPVHPVRALIIVGEASQVGDDHMVPLRRRLWW